MNQLLVSTALLLPIVASLISFSVKRAKVSEAISIATSLVLLAISILAMTSVVDPSRVVIDGLFRLDRLAQIMLLVIGSVSTLAGWASISFLDSLILNHEFSRNPQGPPPNRRTYWALFNIFSFAMVLAVLSNNLGITWVAIETTTIATTFLVGFKRTPLSLEAAWKYAMICSFGIAIALLGVSIVYFAAVHGGLSGSQALQINVLTTHFRLLDHSAMRLGVGLMILGFGAKAGLVPFHSWLPDAHSQAPAPISALMSGVLISVAFSVILRVVSISNLVLGSSYAHTYLAVMGLASMAVASLLLINQRDYKRMLAQSSIEQIGFVAVAASFGTELAIAALLLHVVVHGLGKSLAFISVGRVESGFHSTEISKVKGLLKNSPSVGFGLIVALCILIGLPPFGLFWSETAIITSASGTHFVLVSAGAIAFILISSVALARSVLKMTLGLGDSGSAIAVSRGFLPIAGTAFLASVLLGILASPTNGLLIRAAHSIVGIG
ncbi:MAG: hydrogenase [Acidimicrobiaceae bacterium]|nr:hydrogenase [Acidimicrobiaceae bacterium]